MDLFISWSGDVSGAVARALKPFLERLIRDLEAFVSAQDIEVGERFSSRLDSELERGDHAVLCLTRDNQQAPWINYEAGALAKAVGRSQVIPYTIGFPPREIVPGPLSKFQGVPNDKTGTWKLVADLDKRSKGSRGESFLREGFDTFWPKFEAEMRSAVALGNGGDVDAAGGPSDRELLLEMRADLQEVLHHVGARVPDLGDAVQIVANATTDPVSGLANRVAFHNRLERLTEARAAFVIALLDIDAFKNVNDTYGHLIGDQVIGLIGRVLKDVLIGTADLAARIGGEEFAVIFLVPPERVAKSISSINEVIARAATEAHLPIVTVSAGISSDRDQSVREKIDEAHRALYDAKRKGPGSVVIT